MKKSQYVKGFTLVELMAVIFVVAILVGTIAAILTSGRVSYHTGETQIELQQELRKGMDAMVRELAQSGHTVVLIETINNPDDTIKFRQPQDIDGDGTVLNATTGAIEWSNQTQFLLEGTQLLMQPLDAGGSPTGEPTVLSNAITGVVFTGIPEGDPTSVNIQLSASKNTPENRTVTSTLSSQVTFRN